MSNPTKLQVSHVVNGRCIALLQAHVVIIYRLLIRLLNMLIQVLSIVGWSIKIVSTT